MAVNTRIGEYEEMNKRKWKQRIVSLLVIVLLTVSMIERAVYAEDTQPTIYTATDFTSFRDAVGLVQDGDIIMIMGNISINRDFTIGSESKHLTIEKHTSNSSITFSTGEYSFQNVTFDGGSVASANAFIMMGTVSTATFQDCIFQNCGDMQNKGSSSSIGGAVRVISGTSTFTGCKFKDNCALVGGHMAVNDAVVELNDCTFENGAAVSEGGAIRIISDSGVCNINSSTITGNQAGDVGGGISNTGKVTVDQSKIYANTATNGGADICNKTFGSITLNDNIEQMVELFKGDNINPIGWVCDYDFEQNIYIPDVDPSAENTLLKLDYEIITQSEPETEAPTETPTEQPTTPSTEEPSTEPGTETPSTEESSEPSSEPSSESPSEPDTTPSTPSDADDSSQSGNNITNIDISTNNSSNNTTDNSSGDSNVSNVTNNNTSDNSDRSSRTEQNDSSNNSTTTNNYYTTKTPAEGQGQQTGNSTVVVVPDASNQVTTYSTGVSVSTDNTNEGDSVGQAAVNNAPDIMIDAKNVDVVFGYSESGGYNISINASEVVKDKADEKQSISWFDVIQIVLLGAILICLLYKPKSDKVKKYSLKEE